MKNLKAILNPEGKITIAALDHRGSLKKELHPDNPEATTQQEILAWKQRMIELFKDEVSGILVDPVYGGSLLNNKLGCGWMLSMEKTGYRGSQEARETEIIPGWSVAKAKAMGASGVKLLLYYDPANKELAVKQRMVAQGVAEECKREEMIFLLEPLSYTAKREGGVEAIVDELKDLEVDVFKLEYPESPQECSRISQKLQVPWVLLSAGMEYGKYREALQIACQNGASGMAVGRAVWQEFGDYQGEEREKYLKETALPRMKELVAIVNQYGKAV